MEWRAANSILCEIHTIQSQIQFPRGGAVCTGTVAPARARIQRAAKDSNLGRTKHTAYALDRCDSKEYKPLDAEYVVRVSHRARGSNGRLSCGS